MSQPESTRQAIASPHAPKAVGPYTPAIRVGSMIFCSGQIPLDPESGEVVAGGIEEQTRQVLLNLQATLRAADVGLGEIAKTTVFMTDLGEFAAMNRVYAEFFPGVPPARSTIQVAALPKGSKVEIEALAVDSSATGTGDVG